MDFVANDEIIKEKHRTPNYLEPSHFSTAIERRSEARYPATMDGAWIGWWVDEEFRQTRAMIVNLSQNGMSLVTIEPPDHQGDVFISIEIPSPSEWLEARLIERVPTEAGTHQISLLFLRPIPYDLFKAAVYGLLTKAESVGGSREGLSPPPVPAGLTTS